MIAIVSIGEGCPDGNDNASLFAAAPDLLAALENILACRPMDTANAVDLWLNRGAIEDMARAALAKAKGVQS